MLQRGKRCLVTGGAGFIGSSFIRFGLQHIGYCEKVINYDLLTYAADERGVKEVESDPRYLFVHADIADGALIESLCREHHIDTIVHFAAETHVDRSIESPAVFYETNVMGTLHLLEAARHLPDVHFHHISTDEVYGPIDKGLLTEKSAYAPSSPYAASKAAADHLVRAYAHTYGLSTTISHCCNNFGPYQNVEKFIPRMVSNLLASLPLPVYGNGGNIREWLYVEDHAEAIWKILEKGRKAETYNIGSGCELSNIDMLHQIIQQLSCVVEHPEEELKKLITYVRDRPGHDFRYGIDSTKIRAELGWSSRHSCAEALEKTIAWYVNNKRVNVLC